MGKYRLAIVEDRKIIADSMIDYFASSAHFELVFTSSSYEHFVDNWQGPQIDLLLCDIGLPGKSGIEMVWYVKSKAPDVHVVMFTVFDDRDAIFQALRAGAAGFLLKNTPLPKVEQELLAVLQGGSVMSPHVARQIIQHFNPLLDKRYASVEEQLTPREIEIVYMLQNGDSYKRVAEEIGVSIDAIKFHIRNIYGKLQINSRAELINRYKRK